MSVAVSFAALVLAFVLLFLLSFAGRRRGRRGTTTPDQPSAAVAPSLIASESIGERS